MYKRPELKLQTTTLWDYPSQHYGEGMQGDRSYRGATPSYVIWNLLQRYTKKGDVVVDPCCGSGTTLDVCHDLERAGYGYDIAPFRNDIVQADARRLPLKDASVDFLFIDPPYATHLKYSGHPQCIGELEAGTGAYYEAMDKVIREMWRVLKDRRVAALYVSDSWKKNEPFQPLGFELFRLMREAGFKPIDIVAVVRRNKTMSHQHWTKSAELGNYFLRGFNYLFIMKKELSEGPKSASGDDDDRLAVEKVPSITPLKPKPKKPLRYGKKKRRH